MPMIHISGLGVAGSYLLNRLSQSGYDVTSYDPRRDGYYLPCGYATNENLLGVYLSNAGLKAEDYVLRRAHSVIFSGNNFGEISFDSRGMCTIDKKRLESDLVEGLVKKDPEGHRSADIVVDATGISRALLGRHEDDYTMYAREYLSPRAVHDDFYFYFFRQGHGYFWEFPMDNGYHVGAGSDDLEMIDERLGQYEKFVVTGRKIRLAPLFDRVSRGNVTGIGEAVGTVSPISGEGIIPSLKSAEFFFEALKRYENDRVKMDEHYRSRLEKEFGYYRKLRALVHRIQIGGKAGLSDISAARAAKKDLENFGIDFRISRVIGHFL